MQIEINAAGVIKGRMKRPFNAHVHVRERNQLDVTVPYSAQQFERIVAMPNTVEPLVRVKDVLSYKKQIERIGRAFDPHFVAIVPLYVTDETTSHLINTAHAAGITVAKLYPMGATTQSHKGVSTLEKIYPVLDVMQDLDMILSVHGEIVDNAVDFFDRERVFVERVLYDIAKRYPRLRIILEHVSTKEGVNFVESASDKIAGTITIQHMMFNRNHLFENGLQPHRFCYPVINSLEDQRSVVKAVYNKKFFLGTDSAPHAKQAKCRDGGSGGCFTEPYALALYAHVLESMGALHLMEDFASLRGPNFYGFSPSTHHVKLIRETDNIIEDMPIGANMIATPFLHGHEINWRFEGIVQ